jgi:hypothetical protein
VQYLISGEDGVLLLLFLKHIMTPVSLYPSLWQVYMHFELINGTVIGKFHHALRTLVLVYMPTEQFESRIRKPDIAVVVKTESSSQMQK